MSAMKDSHGQYELELHCDYEKSCIAEVIKEMAIDTVKDLKERISHSQMGMRDWDEELKAIQEANDGFHVAKGYVMFSQGPDIAPEVEVDLSEFVTLEAKRMLNAEMDAWDKVHGGST